MRVSRRQELLFLLGVWTASLIGVALVVVYVIAPQRTREERLPLTLYHAMIYDKQTRPLPSKPEAPW